jgi:hypothetical protein
MPQISALEFYAVPLRVHTFLAGVPLHDVWAVDLPRLQRPATLAALDPLGNPDRRAERLAAPALALLRLRFLLGRIFRLETAPKDAYASSFATRLTPQDRTRSSTATGTPQGLFRVVYTFENESLLELHNRTAHAAALTALAQTGDGYRFYLAVYVARSSWITPFYMALIDPFRKWIVYPAILRSVERAAKAVPVAT